MTDPCHLWQDAIDQDIEVMDSAMARIQFNTPLLIQCRLDHPGSGPQPNPPAPVPMQQQQGIRQISDSEVQSETEDQRTVRMALETIRRQLEIVKRVTRN